MTKKRKTMKPWRGYCIVHVADHDGNKANEVHGEVFCEREWAHDAMAAYWPPSASRKMRIAKVRVTEVTR